MLTYQRYGRNNQMYSSRYLYWHILIRRNTHWCVDNMPCVSCVMPNLRVFRGMKRFPAGRMGDSPARGLSESLARAGFKLGRLQTGTPARLDARTVNLKGLEAQEGDADPSPFSFMNATVANKASHTLSVHRKDH